MFRKNKNRQKKHGKWFRNAIIFLLCTVMICHTVPKDLLVITTYAASSSSSLAEVKARLAQIESGINSMEEKTDTAKANYEAALAEYDAAKTEYDRLIALKKSLDDEILQLETELEQNAAIQLECQTEMDSLKEQLAEINEKIADTQAKFLERIRINYEDSFTSYLEIVLSSESFADLLYRVDVVASMLAYDKTILKEFEEEKAEQEELISLQTTAMQLLEKTAATISENLPLVEEKKEQCAKLVEEAEKVFTDAADTLTQTEEEKRESEARLAELYEAKQEAEDEADAIIRAAEEARRKAAEEALRKAREEAAAKEVLEAAERAANYVGGQIGWPVDVCYNTITSVYGYRTNPVTGKSELHNGIDIPAAYGSPVYAGNSGTVIVAEWHYSYGYYIVIDHGGGISTLYAHNSQLLVSVGDTVVKGQQIAKVGSTGCSTGNHCHLCVRENGTPVDPMKYVVQP